MQCHVVCLDCFTYACSVITAGSGLHSGYVPRQQTPQLVTRMTDIRLALNIASFRLTSANMQQGAGAFGGGGGGWGVRHRSSNVMMQNGEESEGPILLRFEVACGSQVSFPPLQLCFFRCQCFFFGIQGLNPFHSLYTLQYMQNSVTTTVMMPNLQHLLLIG